MQICLETISACNLHCKMCSFREGMTGDILNKKAISNIIHDVRKINNENKSNISF